MNTLIDTKPFLEFEVLSSDGERFKIMDLVFDVSKRDFKLGLLILRSKPWLGGFQVAVRQDEIARIDVDNRRLYLETDHLSLETRPHREYSLPGMDISSNVDESFDEGQALMTEVNGHKPSPSRAIPYTEIIKFNVKGADGDMGRVGDFTLDTVNMRVTYMEVDTDVTLYDTHTVVLPISVLKDVDVPNKTLRLDILAHEIENTSVYDDKHKTSVPVTDESYP